VCGRAIGYQYGNPDAFGANFGSSTINEVYVDGLSITYGMPRQHIWTYAAAVSEVPIIAYTASNCPCSNNPGTLPPSYLGDNWYCESGNPDPINPQAPSLLSNDPLWDGENLQQW
jgi:dynein heavy chain